MAKVRFRPPETSDAFFSDDAAESKEVRMGDQEIRGHGFQIHSRPSGGPPLWRRPGGKVTYTQAEVESIIRWGLAEKVGV